MAYRYTNENDMHEKKTWPDFRRFGVKDAPSFRKPFHSDEKVVYPSYLAIVARTRRSQETDGQGSYLLVVLEKKRKKKRVCGAPLLPYPSTSCGYSLGEE